eukprot:CAMPEP_0185406472 /NCGR_PEP_ID=MMETSP1365-20130426/733_1 /TAXON_ID=38817 /ORGANISM="Gephyrocapsa oceanica, Strain RCC1303" /LENGTH=93 /DNA_ID=CAMNT_0028008843 /DNA_START=12 /DNA_END=292 /DNA_ORIENTATION=+
MTPPRHLHDTSMTPPRHLHDTPMTVHERRVSQVRTDRTLQAIVDKVLPSSDIGDMGREDKVLPSVIASVIPVPQQLNPHVAKSPPHRRQGPPL